MNRVIGYHTQTKAGLKTTRIVSVQVDSKEDGQQLSLFSEDTWKEDMIKTIKKFQIFYPSEIDLICESKPPKDCMVGSFYRTLAGYGKIIKTGEYRKSPRDVRKGGIEWQYKNICV